ncbi:MAG: hypothetical protein AAF456_09240 [Planctomycetota bacterium]
MNNDHAFPTSYEHWRHCIEVLGKIELTPAYVRERITILEDGGHAESRKFAKLYGDEHLQRILAWFRQAAKELA